MRQAILSDGTHVPALGQGTWNMAERADARPEEIAALRDGVERGLTLIDTAEMYADGRSEELVGEAIAGMRDSVFLVTKAYPHHAGRDTLPRACEASLRRLGIERIDLYFFTGAGACPWPRRSRRWRRWSHAG